jgi:hypothetical protein
MKNMFDDLESELKIHLKGFVKGQAGNLFDSLWGYVLEKKYPCDFWLSHKLEFSDLKKRFNGLSKAAPNRFSGSWSGDIFKGCLHMELLDFKIEIPLEVKSFKNKITVKLSLGCFQNLFRDDIEKSLKRVFKEILKTK